MTAPLPPVLIESEVLSLRRFSVDDLHTFQSYRSDPEVGRFQSWQPMTDAQARAFLSEMAAAPLLGPGHWFQIAIEADGLIGDMGLCLSADGQEVEFGITLARAAQGRSWALAAVRLAAQLVWRETAAQRIVAITDARNTRALSLVARTAFGESEPLVTDGVEERVFILQRPDLP